MFALRVNCYSGENSYQTMLAVWIISAWICIAFPPGKLTVIYFFLTDVKFIYITPNWYRNYEISKL